MHFIVRLFPEITIKSPPVRKRFTRHLRNNIRDILRPLGKGIQVNSEWEKIEVLADVADEAMVARVSDALGNIPGIAHYSLVKHHPLKDQHDVFEKTLEVWGEALEGKTFCVRAKRVGTHDFTSIDIERYVGGGLNQHSKALGVKLKGADITVQLEIKNDQLYVIENRRKGLGGFPLGSQEPVLSLVSGGFDSTVASYLTMKRGIRTHFCFFNLGGREHEVGVKEVSYFLWNKYGSSHRVKFVSIPFEEVVTEILLNVKNSHMGVILKRMMLRAASQVAAEMEIQALVTGESVAQVSSQTLPNLAVIDQVTDTLVLRPLIVMDKGDIIDISRNIGTEEFAANMPEYCGVISVKPTTRAKLDDVLEHESGFDMEKLEQAIAQRKVQSIDEVVADLDYHLELRTVAVAEANDIIIDIRHPDEQERKPMSEAAVLVIPFYTLSRELSQLDSSKNYLLYCEKGIMSQLHAGHLCDAGHSNVGVYRPA